VVASRTRCEEPSFDQASGINVLLSLAEGDIDADELKGVFVIPSHVRAASLAIPAGELNVSYRISPMHADAGVGGVWLELFNGIILR
jgi:hypothetical protein